MEEALVRGRTLPEAYHEALRKLHELGEISPCPDYNTNQKELSMTLCVEEPLGEPMISKLFIGGYRELEQYRQEMLDGILDFEIERGNWVYTYHSRMEGQVDFVIRELRRNPTRAAPLSMCATGAGIRRAMIPPASSTYSILFAQEGCTARSCFAQMMHARRRL